MKKRLAIPLAIIMLASAGLFAGSFSDEYTEAIYSVKYSRLQADYFVFLKGDSVYLPLQDMLAFLKIFYEENADMQIKGYVNTPKNTFVIDFAEGKAINTAGNEFDLPKDMWVRKDLKYFVRTEFIDTVFQCSTKTIHSDLVVYLRSPEDMPVLREIELSKKAGSFTKKEEAKLAPIRYHRSFQIINGGTMDYSLGYSHSNFGESYNGYASVGMEVLGGEFQYNNSFSYIDDFKYDNNFRLRYKIDSKFLNFAAIGNVTNMSYRSTNIRGYRRKTYNLIGAQISNEQMMMPRAFSTYIIEDKIGPDWKIELYLNNELYEIKTADINGYYRFEIPVNYGNTNISIKLYGPNGEYIAEEKLINVPGELLPPGEFRYSLTAGEDKREKVKAGNANLSVGLTDWLTSSVFATKTEGSPDYELVGQSAFKVLNNLVMNLTATNSGLYQGALKLSAGSVGMFDLVYATYDRSMEENISAPLHDVMLYGTFNRFLGLPFSLRMQGSRSDFEDRASNDLSGDLSMYLGGISLSYRHNVIYNQTYGKYSPLNHSASARATYYLSNSSGFFSFLGGLRFTATADFNPVEKELRRIGASVEQRISNDFNISFSYDRDMQSNTDRMQMSINMNLPYFRSRSSANLNEKREASYQADLSGALEFDSQNFQINMVNTLGSSAAYGRSSAAVRFFIDKNFNGEYEHDEDEFIPEADFVITNDHARKIKRSDYISLNNLVPYRRYNLKVKEESFTNPVIQPKYKEFSFVTDPYSYKRIDIPCYPTGIVEGTVYRKSGSEAAGQPGVKIHIISKDSSFTTTVNVFSDGSYYCSELPIGDYEAYINEMQVGILKCTSDPPRREFTISPSLDGDFIGGIDFLLKPKVEN